MLAGRLIQGFGIGLLLAGSTALVAVGVLGFSGAPAFALFLLVTPIVGFGSGAIDAALNTYAARSFGPKHMSWLHAAYAAGATAGPAIMTAVLSRGASWRVGYAVVGVILAALVVAFVAARKLWEAGQVRAAGGGRCARWRRSRAAGRAAWSAASPRSAVAGSGCRLRIFFFYTGHGGLRRPVELHAPHRGARPRRHGRGHLGRGLLGRAPRGAARAGLRGRAGGAGPACSGSRRSACSSSRCSSPSPG